MKLLERKIQPFFQWDVLHKRLCQNVFLFFFCTAQALQIINVKNGPVERQAWYILELYASAFSLLKHTGLCWRTGLSPSLWVEICLYFTFLWLASVRGHACVCIKTELSIKSHDHSDYCTITSEQNVFAVLELDSCLFTWAAGKLSAITVSHICVSSLWKHNLLFVFIVTTLRLRLSLG